jgi:hypothetical protein
MPFAIAIEEDPGLRDVDEKRSTSRCFWREVVKLYIHHDPRTRELKLLTEYLKLVKPPGPAAPERVRHNVEQAKSVPIESLFSPQRVRTGGSRITCCCPFHDDKTPSFVIYKETNTFYCFSACGEGGDVIRFVMKLNSCDFKQAVEYLNGR